ncbi:hypothetical protein D9758_016870 [Tetrapyrgos nigripes]|uniref:NAD(P)-binding protein n=1 Tax=Tetrapyrgos nigripes TaxID=182062 RepID=A0A8H5BYB1_9AGAR|nr:hypothetical protein D9758_016870 [Tetrapyrgos nigripes]
MAIANNLQSLQSLKSFHTNNLSGRVALVTGGGTGVGLTIARGFVANGAKVYITGRREDVLKQAAEQTVGLIPLKMDIRDKESIAHAAGILEREEGKLDVLVNNAGIVTPVSPFLSDKSTPKNSRLGLSLFQSESSEDWQNAFATNTIAPFFTTTGFSDLLEKGARMRGDHATSSVINISSAAGSFHSSLNAIAYGTTKAGLDHLTGTLAREFAIHKVPVRVNGIAPGPFPSEITGIPEEIDRQIKEGTFFCGTVLPPIERSGREEEITSAVVWLASDGGAFTNGVTLRIDGGLALVTP